MPKPSLSMSKSEFSHNHGAYNIKENNKKAKDQKIIQNQVTHGLNDIKAALKHNKEADTEERNLLMDAINKLINRLDDGGVAEKKTKTPQKIVDTVNESNDESNDKTDKMESMDNPEDKLMLSIDGSAIGNISTDSTVEMVKGPTTKQKEAARFRAENEDIEDDNNDKTIEIDRITQLMQDNEALTLTVNDLRIAMATVLDVQKNQGFIIDKMKYTTESSHREGD